MRHHLATVVSAVLAVTMLGLSWAWAQGVVLAVGAMCAAIVGIVAAVRTISGLAPVRWIWRRLVGEPASAKFRSEVREAIIEWWSAPGGPGERLGALEADASTDAA